MIGSCFAVVIECRQSHSAMEVILLACPALMPGRLYTCHITVSLVLLLCLFVCRPFFLQMSSFIRPAYTLSRLLPSLHVIVCHFATSRYAISEYALSPSSFRPPIFAVLRLGTLRAMCCIVLAGFAPSVVFIALLLHCQRAAASQGFLSLPFSLLSPLRHFLALFAIAMALCCRYTLFAPRHTMPGCLSFCHHIISQPERGVGEGGTQLSWTSFFIESFVISYFLRAATPLAFISCHFL